MQPWVLHDLRRTAASGLAALGVQLPVIEKVHNHQSGSFRGVCGVYQRHRYAAEKKAALDLWAAHVSGARFELDTGAGNRFAARRGAWHLDAKVFNDLAETPGVEITIKRKSSDLMHLKSYQIDGRLLRTGAANFSASGLKRQDNDLIVIESPGAAASFKRNFEARYASGG